MTSPMAFIGSPSPLISFSRQEAPQKKRSPSRDSSLPGWFRRTDPRFFCQSKAKAAALSVAAFLGLIKFFKYMRSDFFGHSNSRIADNHQNIVFRFFYGGGNTSVSVCELDCISKNIRPYLIKEFPVSIAGHLGQLHINVQILGVPERLQGKDSLPELLVQGKKLLV